MSEEPKPGWLYKTRIFKHDQAYGLCVPVSTVDGWYMQDTYQLGYPFCHDGENKQDAAIRQAIGLSDGEDHMWTIRHCRGEFYHKASSIFNESDFEPICDLREYRYVSDRESEHYDDADLVRHVRLYKEHGYSWTYGDIGISIVRKDAEKSDVLIFRQEMHDVIRSQHWPDYSISAKKLMDNIPAELPNSDRIDLERIIATNELLERQRKEVLELDESFRDRMRKECEAMGE